jgi:hypothetical protein
VETRRMSVLRRYQINVRGAEVPEGVSVSREMGKGDVRSAPRGR